MSQTILAVDDEPQLVSLYEAWLAGRYDVRTATDGETALAIAEEGVSAVLLDRQMPGLSGDEVLARLRERGHTVPVALVTAARPDPADFYRPFDDYLTKPTERECLLDTVERLLAVESQEAAVRQSLRAAAKLGILEECGSTGTESYDAVRESLEADFHEAMSRLGSMPEGPADRFPRVAALREGADAPTS